MEAYVSDTAAAINTPAPTSSLDHPASSFSDFLHTVSAFAHHVGAWVLVHAATWESKISDLATDHPAVVAFVEAEAPKFGISLTTIHAAEHLAAMSVSYAKSVGELLAPPPPSAVVTAPPAPGATS
jgi:hypothetical protein